MWNAWNTAPPLPAVKTDASYAQYPAPPSTVPSAAASIPPTSGAAPQYPGSQYTAAQYAALSPEQQLALQQHWQQWQKYQEEYAKWHAQYGEQYNREMAAAMGGSVQPASTYPYQPQPPLPPPENTQPQQPQPPPQPAAKISGKPQLYPQAPPPPQNQGAPQQGPQLQGQQSQQPPLPPVTNPKLQQTTQIPPTHIPPPQAMQQNPPPFQAQPFPSYPFPPVQMPPGSLPSTQMPPPQLVNSQYPPPPPHQQPQQYPMPMMSVNQPPPNFNSVPANVQSGVQQELNMNNFQGNNANRNFQSNTNPLPPNQNPRQFPNQEKQDKSRGNFGGPLNQSDNCMSQNNNEDNYFMGGENMRNQGNRPNFENSPVGRNFNNQSTNNFTNTGARNFGNNQGVNDFNSASDRNFNNNQRGNESNSSSGRNFHNNQRGNDFNNQSGRNFSGNQGGNNFTNPDGQNFNNNPEGKNFNNQRGNNFNTNRGNNFQNFGSNDNRWNNDRGNQQCDRDDNGLGDREKFQRFPNQRGSNPHFERNQDARRNEGWQKNQHDGDNFQNNFGPNRGGNPNFNMNLGNQCNQSNWGDRGPGQGRPGNQYNPNHDNQRAPEMDEESFERLFRQWEEQFENWKKANANNPDREMYQRYEQEFEKQRRRIIDRRDQMRRRKMEAMGMKEPFPQNQPKNQPENTTKNQNDNEGQDESEKTNNEKPKINEKSFESTKLDNIRLVGDNQEGESNSADKGDTVKIISQVNIGEEVSKDPQNTRPAGKRKSRFDAPIQNKTARPSTPTEVINLDDDDENDIGETAEESSETMSTLFRKSDGIPGLDLVEKKATEAEPKKEKATDQLNSTSKKIPSLFDIVVQKPDDNFNTNQESQSELQKNSEAISNASGTSNATATPDISSSLKDPDFMKKISEALAKAQGKEKVEQNVKPSQQFLDQLPAILEQAQTNKGDSNKLSSDESNKNLSFSEWQSRKAQGSAGSGFVPENNANSQNEFDSKNSNKDDTQRTNNNLEDPMNSPNMGAPRFASENEPNLGGSNIEFRGSDNFGNDRGGPNFNNHGGPNFGNRGGEFGPNSGPNFSGPFDNRFGPNNGPNFGGRFGPNEGNNFGPNNSRFGPNGGPNRSFGGNNGPFGGPNGPFGGPNGPFGGPNGPFGGPNGPFGGPNGPFNGPSGPFNGPNGPYDGPNGPNVRFGSRDGQNFGGRNGPNNSRFGQNEGRNFGGPNMNDRGNFGPNMNERGNFGPNMNDRGNFGPNMNDRGDFGSNMNERGNFGPNMNDRGNFGGSNMNDGRNFSGRNGPGGSRASFGGFNRDFNDKPSPNSGSKNSIESQDGGQTSGPATETEPKINQRNANNPFRRSGGSEIPLFDDEDKKRANNSPWGSSAGSRQDEYFRPMQVIDYQNTSLAPKVIDYGHKKSATEFSGDFMPVKTFEYGHSSNPNINPRNTGQSQPSGRFHQADAATFNQNSNQNWRNKRKNKKKKNNDKKNMNTATVGQNKQEQRPESTDSNDQQNKPSQNTNNVTLNEQNQQQGDHKESIEKPLDDSKDALEEISETEDDLPDDNTLRDNDSPPPPPPPIFSINVPYIPGSQSFGNISSTSDSIFPSTAAANKNVKEVSAKHLQMSIPSVENHNTIAVDEIILNPGRLSRPKKICIVLRGPPGSGKSHMARLIKEKENEMGGANPRILSIDDYFIVENDYTEKCPKTGKMLSKKEILYEYDKDMEETYMQYLIKQFKKTIADNLYDFIIVDCNNNSLRTLNEFYCHAKDSGFMPYIVDLKCDIDTALSRNVHSRNEEDIRSVLENWNTTPLHYIKLDCSSLLENLVEMEDADDMVTEKICSEENSMTNDTVSLSKEGTALENEAEEDSNEAAEEIAANCGFLKSKWENDTTTENLARLDGTNKLLTKRKATMEDFLQMDDWEPPKTSTNGKKRVRWADIEEKRAQDKMRAIGFVVGQTDWKRMMDPNAGRRALNQTKYIERVNKRQNVKRF